MSSDSQLANYLLTKIKQDHKIKKLVKGRVALDAAKMLFFGNKRSKQSIKWAKRWNNYEKSQSIFVVYENKKQKKQLVFKFIIGTRSTGSSLGEKHPYATGLEVIKRIF